MRGQPASRLITYIDCNRNLSYFLKLEDNVSGNYFCWFLSILRLVAAMYDEETNTVVKLI